MGPQGCVLCLQLGEGRVDILVECCGIGAVPGSWGAGRQFCVESRGARSRETLYWGVGHLGRVVILLELHQLVTLGVTIGRGELVTVQEVMDTLRLVLEFRISSGGSVSVS
jgi:hypothetical protein